MKKIISLLLVLVCAMSLFSGCTSNKSKTQDVSSTKVIETAETTKDKTNAIDIKSKTLDGEDINNDIFKDYDLTMVNIWATWCGACVGEMGELQKLYEKLSEDKKVNLISICEDAEDDKELAKKILEENGCKFKSVIPNEYIRKNLLEGAALPTTIFVNKDGEIVGEKIEGAPAENVVEEYLKEIDSRLNK